MCKLEYNVAWAEQEYYISSILVKKMTITYSHWSNPTNMATENYYQVPLKKISKIYCTISSTWNYETENYLKALAIIHKTRITKLNVPVLFIEKTVA